MVSERSGPSVSPSSDLTFWTGGWDSTFRVLQRARVEKIDVHPCYVVDRGRASAGAEVEAMNRLLRTLDEHDPETLSRIAPIRYVARGAIPAVPAITEAWEHLRETLDIGSQYDWLARLAESEGWSQVELCIHGKGRLRPVLGDHVRSVERADGRVVYEVSPTAPEAVRLVFGRFAFPFWPTDKHEDFEEATRQGLVEILDDHAWFCFAPTNGRPCGACRPCQFMIRDGFAHRIPRAVRVRNRIARVVGDTRKRVGLRTRLRGLVGR